MIKEEKMSNLGETAKISIICLLIVAFLFIFVDKITNNILGVIVMALMGIFFVIGVGIWFGYEGEEK